MAAFRVFLAIYAALLLYYFIIALRERAWEDPSEYLAARGKVGLLWSIMGVAATLFSAFTLLGMPGLFRSHGIGAWIFLGVTDVCLAGLLLYIGSLLRSSVKSANFTSSPFLTDYIATRSGTRWPAFAYVGAASLFLIPYVVIQISGAALVLSVAEPSLNAGQWGVILVVAVLMYSGVGGIKNIYRTDIAQGLLILVVAWTAAVWILNSVGGPAGLFSSVAESQSSLLSTPGPSGLMTVEFLTISFISICLMPYTQPQLATRILLVRTNRDFRWFCLGLGVFAFLVILPTLVLGFRGIQYSNEGPGGWVVAMLYGELPGWLAGLYLVGIVAASMSTIDSQIFAIGSEWQVLMGKRMSGLAAGLLTAAIGMLAAVLARRPLDSIVLFSTSSFIGTSLLFPLVLTTLIGTRKEMLTAAGISALATGAYAATLIGVIPARFYGIRLEVILWIAEAAFLALVVLNYNRAMMVLPRATSR